MATRALTSPTGGPEEDTSRSHHGELRSNGALA